MCIPWTPMGAMEGLADPATEPWFVWFNEQLQLLPDFITVENSHLFQCYDLFSRHLESTHYIVPIIFGPEDDHVDYHDADMACDEDACDVEDDEPVFKTMATMCTMAGP